MEEFSSGPLFELVRERLSLHASLQVNRGALVDHLYSVINGASAELRRFMLSVKRDCFNGRALGKYQGSPHWPELLDRTGDLAVAVLALEERLAVTQEELRTVYRVEKERELGHLVALLGETALMRGIALASPLLVGAAERLRKPTEDYGRRERKAEISLLRYLSRAAFKTSPFSTLTRLGLATIQSQVDVGRGFHFTGPLRERSLVRLKRYLLTQYRQLLLRYPPFLESLEIRLNDSITEVASGRFRFFRPATRDFDEASGAMKYMPASVVRLNLRAPVAGWLRAHLAEGGGLAYGVLLRTLENESFGEPKELVDHLLALGFLHACLPWSSNEIHLEHEMLRYLRSLPEDERLENFITPFARLIAIQDSYAITLTPEVAVAEVDQLLHDMWEAGRPLFNLGAAAEYVSADKCDLFEDVLLMPKEGVGRDILRISHTTAFGLVQTVAPLISFLNLYNNRYDFLHSLAAFAVEHWPGEHEIGLLEVFDAVQPLWRGYQQFGIAMRRSGEWRDTFDPLGLNELDALRRMREAVWEELLRRVEVGEEGCRLTPENLADILSGLPLCYAPITGGCLFLQPISIKGNTWVLNRLFDGTGRYGSRYTTIMDEEMRRDYTDHLLACSQIEQGGQQFELLDLMCSQGDTLNIHAAQTPRLVVVPGEDSDLPAARQVSLRDLRVRFRGGELPALVDSGGRHYLPVHLGGTNLTYMPVLLKFLSVFGPGEHKNVQLPRKQRLLGDVSVYEPLWLGGVLLSRRRWVVSPRYLKEKLEMLDESGAFEAVNRWRLEIGIPDRVFIIERLTKKFADEFYKPQYIDFTSPSFGEIIQSSLQVDAESFTIEEMVPTPDAYPADIEGRRWAVELQLDTLVLNHGHTFAIEFGAREAPASPAGTGEVSLNRAVAGSERKE